MKPDFTNIVIRPHAGPEVNDKTNRGWALMERTCFVNDFGGDYRLITMPNWYWNTMDRCVADGMITYDEIYEDICRVSDGSLPFELSVQAWIDAFYEHRLLGKVHLKPPHSLATP